MRIRLDATTTAAVLLSTMALLNAVTGGRELRLPAVLWPAQSARPWMPRNEFERLALEICRENVTIIHDVHWAAACMTNPEDDASDCTLPDERAATLNAARWAAEDRCVDELAAQRRVARAN
jgi:hypothetical protein